ncbi:hypothetical protein [Mesomycoplasma dispar]|uniref:Uncharacterized protein n=1 Tax=Mesomycoplasma dispar TaxID=86660 RepID=A0ABN5DV73_9BACT|nr:hypothetical protein [Mesomycoplasma dispar]ATP59542.1 hypothetical protein CSW10_01070 [Mesomycoplasma dispar]
MKRKIKILKYIANFFAFSALSLSTIIPLTYQQKTILKQNFNVLNRDFDENYNKKIANFSDFLELKSVQEDGQNLIIKSKLKKSFSLIQQTSTNLKINNDQYFNLIVKPNSEVLVNSKELKIFNEIGKIYLKNKTPHLVFRGYDLDFDALVKYKKIEKTFFFAIPAIVWAIGGAIIAATGTYALHEVGKSIADSIPADNVFGGLGSWGQSVGYIEKIEADDVFKKDKPIKKDEAIAAAKTITFSCFRWRTT